MTRKMWILAAAAAVSCASIANAGTTTSITLYPNSDGDGNSIGSSSAAPGFPTSSIQADASTLGGKSEIYIPVAALFTGTVAISDIQSISFWTNKPGSSGEPDWTLLLYTNTTGTGDEASWYHSRLNAEPYLTSTSNASDPANTWHQWSTNDATNPLRFYDAGRNGGVFGTYTDPTLAQLSSGAVTWNGATENDSTVNYTADTIKFFSMQTGTSWGDGFTGQLDGLTVTLNDGDVGIVNFEATPVPLPASAGVGLTMLVGFGAMFAVRKQFTRKPRIA